MWKRFSKKLTTTEPRGKPFRGPSMEDLREFEVNQELLFPTSYKAFAAEVGAGSFCNGYYNIYAPDFGLEAVWKVRGLDLFKDIYGDKEFVDRAIPFGDTAGGDVLCWDPHDVSSNRPLEYGVYVFPRDSRKVIRLCDDFKTFVHTAVFGEALIIALCGGPDPEWRIAYSMYRIRPSRRTSRYTQ